MTLYITLLLISFTEILRDFMLPKWYKYFNYGSIIVIAILLLLMLTETVPKETFFEILIFAIALLLLRVVFRVYFLFKSKKAKEE